MVSSYRNRVSIDHLMNPLTRGLQDLALYFLEEQQLLPVGSVHLHGSTRYKLKQRIDGNSGHTLATSLGNSAGNCVHLCSV